MTNAGIYLRVSTDEQAERFGLKAMHREALALAERKGYRVMPEAIYIDDGHSGATLDRPALHRLRAALRAGTPFDVLIIPDPDRLARRLALQLLLIEEIEEAGVVIEWGSGPRQQTHEGRLLDNVRGVFAEYEREKIRERTTRGRLEKARRGFYPGGRHPFGYAWDPTQSGRLIIREEHAAIIRMMFRWLVDEQRSTRSISLELRALGIRATRGWWSRSSVQQALTNPVYIGQAYYNRRESLPGQRWGVQFRDASQWIAIPTPALLDEATFTRGQHQLERNRAVLVGRRSPLAYLLRGLLICGACGRRLLGERSHDRGYYRCRGRRDVFDGKPACGHLVRAEHVERPVWGAVVNLLASPDQLAEHVASYRASASVSEEEARSTIANLGRQIAESEREEGKLLDLYAADGAGLESVAQRLKGLSDRKAALRGQLARVKGAVVAQDTLAASYEGIADQCALMARGARKLRPEERQAMLRRLIRRVVCDPSGALEITGFLPLELPASAAGTGIRPACRPTRPGDGRASACSGSRAPASRGDRR
jgi:site-specific DNA recombinase